MSAFQDLETLTAVMTARRALLQDGAGRPGDNNEFYAVLCMYLDPVEAPEVGTAATDGAKFFYNPEYLRKLPPKQRVALWAHEAAHVSLLHHARIPEDWDMEEANIAADLAINPMLANQGYELWPGALLDRQYVGMGMEEIYYARRQKRRQEAERQQQAQQDQQGNQQQDQQSQQGQQGQQAGQNQPGQDQQGKQDQGQQQGQGSPQASDQAGGSQQPGGTPGPAGGAGSGQGGQDSGQGSGSGQGGQQQGQTDGQGGGGAGQQQGADSKPGSDMGKINGGGGIMRPTSEADREAQRETWRVRVTEAAAVAKRANAGEMPGEIARIIEGARAPDLNVRRELERWIDSAVVTRRTWARPNRRLVGQGIYLPSHQVDGLAHVIFAVDDSGSIDNHMLGRATEAIKEAHHDGRIQKLTVLFADTRVHTVLEFEKGDDIELVPNAGGGGTRFADTFRVIAEDFADATAVIYLTDLEVRDQAAWTEPDCPVLWAVHGDSRRFDKLAEACPFGEAIYLGRLE